MVMLLLDCDKVILLPPAKSSVPALTKAGVPAVLLVMDTSMVGDGLKIGI
jgi:hypothetical protein